MLVIEETGKWGALIRKRYSPFFQVQVVSSAAIDRDLLTSHRVIGLEFHPTCFAQWLSLFDKTGFRLENSITAVLGGTVSGGALSLHQKSWCREIGFQSFVDSFDSLAVFIERWESELKQVPSLASWTQESLQNIDWMN